MQVSAKLRVWRGGGGNCEEEEEEAAKGGGESKCCWQEEPVGAFEGGRGVAGLLIATVQKQRGAAGALRRSPDSSAVCPFAALWLSGGLGVEDTPGRSPTAPPQAPDLACGDNKRSREIGGYPFPPKGVPPSTFSCIKK